MRLGDSLSDTTSRASMGPGVRRRREDRPALVMRPASRARMLGMAHYVRRGMQRAKITGRETCMPPTASTLVTVGIPLIAVLALSLVGIGIQRASAPGSTRARNYTLAAATWLAFSGTLAFSGVLARFDALPPPLLLVLVPTLGLPLALGISRIGADVAWRTPIAALVGFHSFRLPLELVMHEAALEGTMPAQMSFSGWNFDIATGASAVVVGGLALYGRAPRWLLLSWNALGSLLLLAIVVIALASLPLFHAFGSAPGQLNTWVAYFPFVWLPAGPVSTALFGHIVLWRRLLGSPRGETN